jgi:hypothetical protein
MILIKKKASFQILNRKLFSRHENHTDNEITKMSSLQNKMLIITIIHLQYSEYIRIKVQLPICRSVFRKPPDKFFRICCVNFSFLNIGWILGNNTI